MTDVKRVIIDAGHGGEEPGAMYDGRREKDDTLRLALAIGRILENNGVDVVYTRTTDVYDTPLEKARIANQSGADYFVSIHRNAFPVQVGAFRTRMPADRLVNELQASGLPAFLVYDDGLYKVRVGAFLNMDYAVQMERNLRNMGYPTVLVRERAIY